MSKGTFTERNKKPTQEEINQVLGESLPLWMELQDFIGKHFKTSCELKFYGKNYGWALGFKKSGKSLVSLYPSQSGFTAQIILKEKDIKEIPNALMTEKLKKAMNDAYPYSEGRWLFLSVETIADIALVEQLLMMKN